MRKIGVLVCGGAIILAATGWYLWGQKKQESVHYHAGFRVYYEGVRQDYSEFRYMDLEPCSEHANTEKLSKEEEQIEKAHLHDGVGDVVHVHVVGAVWGDLFKNISVTFPREKAITGYINGKKTENILNMPIVADETAIIMVGAEEASRGAEIVPVEHIREIEAKSELCGTN